MCTSAAYAWCIPYPAGQDGVLAGSGLVMLGLLQLEVSCVDIKKGTDVSHKAYCLFQTMRAWCIQADGVLAGSGSAVGGLSLPITKKGE